VGRVQINKMQIPTVVARRVYPEGGILEGTPYEIPFDWSRSEVLERREISNSSYKEIRISDTGFKFRALRFYK
jgi:hypothetical protein